MDVTKPYKFIWFGAMDVTKPYKGAWPPSNFGQDVRVVVLLGV
jgi:hypothetical protein